MSPHIPYPHDLESRCVPRNDNAYAIILPSVRAYLPLRAPVRGAILLLAQEPFRDRA